MRTSSLLRFAVILLGAVLVVTGCTGTGSGQHGQTDQTEHRGPAGTVPTGLGQYYGQSLHWGGCSSYATSAEAKSKYANPKLQCTRLRVPLDYAHPDGRKISLGVMRRKATGQRVGSLLTNPGGPGVSGMEPVAAALADAVKGNKLGKRFDLVGFDPRGIGSSKPRIRCYTGKERDHQRAQNVGLGTSAGDVEKDESIERDYARKCAERSKDGKALLAHMGTGDVVKDMDVLRSALGDKKLTYAGFSYGTRIGAEYGKQFPRNVRAMVLDGAVDPDQSSIDAIIEQHKGFQQAFESFASWCAKQDQCGLGKDPKQATKRFQRLTRRLIEHPLRLADGRKLTYEDATTGATQALYSQKFWKPLNLGLQQLKQGNGRVLMALADAYYERSPRNGKYSTTQDANMAVSCVDNPRHTDRAKLKKAERRANKVAPFLDSGKPATGERDACAFWPVPPKPLPKLPKVSHLPPTLTISTTGDPATPYEAGANLAEALGGGLLTNEGTQHTAFLQGNKCVDRAGSKYLITGKLPPKGTRC